jgi:hypothetical protein
MLGNTVMTIKKVIYYFLLSQLPGDPSPEYPVLHVQEKLPTLFAHEALVSQGEGEASHSLMSANVQHRISI